MLLKLKEGQIVARAPGKWEPMSRVETTVGRVLFNDILPHGMPFYNYGLTKKNIGGVISDCHKLLGKGATLRLLDDIKEMGFKSATRSGMSFAKNDIAFIDPTGVDHDALGVALKKALYNYMHGIGLDADVRSWFDMKVPKPRVGRHRIAQALEAA